ncbi:MAG: hypothetical protein K0U59_12375 [Gammaproteobacteria bacterium]|nr:hypothetical protein [Gammaproteobacteria bacterium]
MLLLTCELFQCIHLGGIFTIRPVWISDSTVELHIEACDGGHLSRGKSFLPTADEVWLHKAKQQSKQEVQAPSNSESSDDPEDDSESVN